MNLTIHRGTNQIGGSCVEIATTTTRLLIDIGLPLDSVVKRLEDRKQYLPKIEGHIDAVFISHYHLDHHGLVSEIDPSIPVYVSRGTEKMFGINAIFLRMPKVENLRIIDTKTPVMVDDIKITAFTVDHSAYDAMAFLIEAEGKKILYSGDIRTHGVKGRLYEDLPQNVDYLILEGTNIGKSESISKTEKEIKDQFIALFKKYPDRINYVWSSGQNIDRLVQIYSASLKTGRTFVADLYVANVLYEIHQLNANIPSPYSHPNFRVWYAKYEKLNENENLAFRLKRFKIKSKEIADSPYKYVVIVRPSLLEYIQKINAAQANVVTSIWKDYEIRTENEAFFDWVDKKGYKRTHYHTSGHADQDGLRKIVAHISPKTIIPIHTKNKAQYCEIFKNVIVLDDGERFEI
ncbi:MAG: MBL fold metallo-hydrolase [Bacteroidia bacterium]|nr:MBL fold metallo-hydrolase [Bacteroidia bacterium]